MKYSMYCPDNLKEIKVVYEPIIFQEFATQKETLIYILYREPYNLCRYHTVSRFASDEVQQTLDK